MFVRQKPVELDRLVEIAKIQSTEASNRIEGIDYYTQYIKARDDWEFVKVYTDMKTPSLIQFNDLRRLDGRGG